MSVFPVLANADNVFYIQPIARGHPSMQTARAVASGLFYRYTGINSGIGSGEGTAVASTAPRLQLQPLQDLQTVFAEWLLVFAHLSDVISMSDTRVLSEPFIGTQQAPDVILATSGNHVPSFVSLLGFLSDWIGSVVPLYAATMVCGDIKSVTTPLVAALDRIRVSSLPKASPVYRAYVSGRGLSPADFIHSLNTMFTNSKCAEPHPTRVIQVRGHAPVDVRVRRLARKQASVSLPMDISAAADDFTLALPSTITLAEADIPDALRGVSVLVCTCAELPGTCFPVFPIELSDAVLQQVPVLAAAETFVNAVTAPSPGFAELREVTSKALLMGFILPAAAIKQAVRKAFTDRFPASAVPGAGTGAGSDSVPLSVAVTLAVPPDSDSAESVSIPSIPAATTLPVPTPPAPRPCDLIVRNCVITLYFSPEVFGELQPQLLQIRDFYLETQFVEEKNKRGSTPKPQSRFYIIKNTAKRSADSDSDSDSDGYSDSDSDGDGDGDDDDDLIVLANAQRRKRPDGNHFPTDTEVFSIYEVKGQSSERPRLKKNLVNNLSGMPMTSVVFMREDLLAIALSGDRTHQLLKELWDLHVYGVSGCNFDDEASAKIMSDIIESGGDALKHAGLWAHGVLVEVIFNYHDSAEANHLLVKLYNSLQVLVVVHDGRTLLTYRKPTKTRLAAAMPSSVLIRAELTTNQHTDAKGRISLMPLTRAFTIEVADVEMVTVPWLRGACMSLTQLSLFRCTQQHLTGTAVGDALQSIVKAASTSMIHAPELAIAMASDSKIFRRSIAL